MVVVLLLLLLMLLVRLMLVVLLLLDLLAVMMMIISITGRTMLLQCNLVTDRILHRFQQNVSRSDGTAGATIIADGITV